MTAISLTRTETDILQAAAADHGRLHFVPTVKSASHKRLLRRFLRDGLITVRWTGQTTSIASRPGATAPSASPRPNRLTRRLARTRRRRC
jgi:hypothetical protein